MKHQPFCQACTNKSKLEVHHIKPVHVYPELELDPENLITLCEEPDAFCHYIFGHLSLSWYKWNPDVVYHSNIYRNAVLKAQTDEDDKGKIIKV